MGVADGGVERSGEEMEEGLYKCASSQTISSST